MSYPTTQIARNSIIFAVLLGFLAGFLPRIASVSAGSEKKKPTKVATSGPTATNTTQNVSKNFGNLPLSFEPNHGQTNKKIKFLSRGEGYRLFLSATQASLALNSSRESGEMLHMRIVGGNAKGKVTGERKLQGKSNYLIGERSNWKVDLPTYGGVRVEHVYRGIDLVYYGTDQRRLEYDFVVAPGADPKMIRLAFDGVDELFLDADGALHLNTKAGEIVQPAPFIYQELDGKREHVAGHYVLDGKNQVTFVVAAYDRTRTLTIDPQLVYKGYHGGSGDDRAEGVAVDLNGNAYVVGSTFSTNLDQTGALQAPQGGLDAFIVKINPAGTDIVYSTYLGGTRTDYASAVAVTSDGKACITGATNTAGNNFPTRHPYQNNGLGLIDGLDSFVTVLTPAGNDLVYSTFFGGSGNNDMGEGIAVDAANNIYVTGCTLSRNFPTKHAFQGTNSYMAAYVAKFNPNERGNDSLIYSSFLGGDGSDEEGLGIAVTPAGVAFVTGHFRLEMHLIRREMVPAMRMLRSSTLMGLPSFTRASSPVRISTRKPQASLWIMAEMRMLLAQQFPGQCRSRASTVSLPTCLMEPYLL